MVTSQGPDHELARRYVGMRVEDALAAATDNGFENVRPRTVYDIITADLNWNRLNLIFNKGDRIVSRVEFN